MYGHTCQDDQEIDGIKLLTGSIRIPKGKYPYPSLLF